MSNNSKCIFAFVIGAAVGSAVTLRYLKTKYEQLAQEEIDSVKEAFSRRAEPEGESEPKPMHVEQAEATTQKRPELVEYYDQMLHKAGYKDYSAISGGVKEEAEAQDVGEPVVICPEEFGDYPDYETIDLVHYADGVLADENDEMVDDVGGAVGDDYADHFGEFEEDIVHIRNDKLKCYYEISRDYRKYSDVVGTMPHHGEG